MSRDKLNMILSARSKLAKALAIAQECNLPDSAQARIVSAFDAVDKLIKRTPKAPVPTAEPVESDSDADTGALAEVA